MTYFLQHMLAPSCLSGNFLLSKQNLSLAVKNWRAHTGCISSSKLKQQYSQACMLFDGISTLFAFHKHLQHWCNTFCFTDEQNQLWTVTWDQAESKLSQKKGKLWKFCGSVTWIKHGTQWSRAERYSELSQLDRSLNLWNSSLEKYLLLASWTTVFYLLSHVPMLTSIKRAKAHLTCQKHPLSLHSWHSNFESAYSKMLHCAEENKYFMTTVKICFPFSILRN